MNLLLQSLLITSLIINYLHKLYIHLYVSVVYVTHAGLYKQETGIWDRWWGLLDFFNEFHGVLNFLTNVFFL